MAPEAIAEQVGESVDIVRRVIKHRTDITDCPTLPTWLGEKCARAGECVRCSECGARQSVYIEGHPCRVCDREIDLLDTYFDY